MRTRWLVTACVVAACGSEPAGSRQISGAMPDYAPLGGGTLITLAGTGFDPGDRVLVAGHEAAFVNVIGATQIRVVVPPGEHPGDVEVVVFGIAGTTTARNVLHYSLPPAITSVSPATIVSTSSDTLVTVIGTGFAAEAAGEPTILVDGKPILEATVVSDTELTFIAPPGTPFTHPALDVLNARGRGAMPRGFKYTLSATPGLLLFPRWGTSFAIFYDPIAQTSVQIPALDPAAPRYRSVLRDTAGVYWAIDAADRLGRLDLETQTLDLVTFVQTRVPTLARVGTQVAGLARNWNGAGQFGRVDTTSGEFTPVGSTSLFCCGSLGITTDGTTVWFTARQDWSTIYITTLDPATGAVGTPVVLTGVSGLRIEELRYWNGGLYATTSASQLVRIDPTTGAVTIVFTDIVRFSALEPYE